MASSPSYFCRALLGWAGGGARPYVVGVVKFRQFFPEKFSPVEHSCRRACETGLPPACRFRSDSRRHRRRRLRLRRCAASPVTARPSKSGRDILPRAHILRPRRFVHALAQRAQQVSGPPFEKQLHIAHRFLINLRRGQSFHAGPQTALDVVLQARRADDSASGPPCRTEP